MAQAAAPARLSLWRLDAALIWQAINRIHRIGQAYPVRVKHFVVQNSVEDRILELQQKKSNLVKGALGGSDEESKAMRIEDLKLLFA